jgi:cytochrome P450
MTQTTSSPRLAPGPNALGALNYGLGFVRDPFAVLHGATDKYGPIVRFGTGKNCLHIIYHPKHVQRVLIDNNKNYEKHSPYAMMQMIFGKGLLFNEGPSWFSQRRLMQPTFQPKQFSTMADNVSDAISTAVDSWPHHDGKKTDIERDMVILARRIIGEILFGAELTPELKGVLDATDTSKANFFLGNLKGTPQSILYKALKRRVDEVVYKLIAERRASKEQAPDLLSILMTAADKDTGEVMNDRQLRDEIVTLLFSGFDTTSRTLSWTFHVLAQHPEIEAKVHAEVDEVLQGRAPRMPDLANLPYTQMVIKETMRVYPPNAVIGRRAKADDELDGYFIPAGSMLTISPYLAQRDPELWENPLTIIPERFSPENEPNIGKFDYYPFGGGPRQCIGKGIAMMTIPLAVATVAQRYRFKAVPGFELKGDIKVTFQSRSGIPATRHLRPSYSA